MPRFSLEDAIEHHGVHLWGGGHFGISADGELLVRPHGDDGPTASVPAVVRAAREAGLSTPLVLRFPQLLAARLSGLVAAFDRARAEFGYDAAPYRPAFPIKVNQRRSVVEPLVEAGRAFGLWLEAGSKTEMLAALGQDLGPEGAVVVNGYKDRDALEIAILGARSGQRVIVVLEKLFELPPLIEAFREAGPGPLPEIGVRARLYARGAGRWWRSTGVSAKFGLTTTGLLAAANELRDAGFLERLTMLHFHVGSQIPEIRRFKTAFREAARIYAQLRRRGAPLSVLDIGGGLAVDYDGSRTSSDASMNYSVQEYANDAVFLVAEVCREEREPLPTIVSESGRAIAAHHALLVADVLGTIEADPPPGARPEITSDSRIVPELELLARQIGAKNYREFFHDAVLHRDEMITLFNHGLISLEERSYCQQLFWEIARKALALSKRDRVPSDEFVEVQRALDEKYVVNFSVFQSLPDHWALDQVFPVLPLQRLLETPTRSATLVDITCDSDGSVDRFIDPREIREALALHPLDPSASEPYDIAVALVGAYQDVMGDMHNLLATPDEASVVVRDDGAFEIVDSRRGDTARDVLELYGYRVDDLRRALRERSGDEALADEYAARFEASTYLDARRVSGRDRAG
jgi:arginine decarboxylase